MKLFLLTILTFFISCSTKQENKKNGTPEEIQTINQVNKDTLTQNTEIIETFTDSLNIGVKGTDKVEIIKHRVFDNTYVIVKFYTKGPDYWYIQNTYLYECDALMGLAPKI